MVKYKMKGARVYAILLDKQTNATENVVLQLPHLMHTMSKRTCDRTLKEINEMGLVPEGKEAIFIKGYENVATTYTCPVDKFMEIATPVETEREVTVDAESKEDEE